VTAAKCPCCGGPVDPNKFIVDLNTNTFCYNGHSIVLRPKTAEFLSVLLSKYPGAASMNEIASGVWGALDAPDDVRGNIHVYLCIARKFLEPIGVKIESAWGAGQYRLVLPR